MDREGTANSVDTKEKAPLASRHFGSDCLVWDDAIQLTGLVLIVRIARLDVKINMHTGLM